MLFATIVAMAAPKVETKNGTLIITVSAAGDLKAENFSDVEKAATKVKIVSDGYSLAKGDMEDFFGPDWQAVPGFKNIVDLDLSELKLQNNDDILRLRNFSQKFKRCFGHANHARGVDRST